MQKEGMIDQNEESVVPEMADAMMELERREKEEEEVVVGEGDGKGGVVEQGAQVFFFPDEGNKQPLAAAMPGIPQEHRRARKEDSVGGGSGARY
jgi:hypothetical protein